MKSFDVFHGSFDYHWFSLAVLLFACTIRHRSLAEVAADYQVIRSSGVAKLDPIYYTCKR
ncbi:hypothetical protein BDV06DRAFT_203472 [Aspergillus oleicola]